jgi:hypothetical protein
MAKPRQTAAKPTRAHRVLWDRDLPFRARTQRDRTVYQRRSKHRAQDSLAESMT